MNKINTRTRLVAGAPIEVGTRRLLPSILVTTVGSAETGAALHGARLRPSSIIEQGPEGNRWHTIPNTTQDRLSLLVGIGLGIALLSSLIILLVEFERA
ncbi:MAG: hypothetical protein U9Q70_08355 [Chloroflexota bacterium]|nr:hypothetical protein [Chloroflexota bacterium]